MIIIQIILNALIIGSIYALVASGFSLIYSTNRFMHFAHGTSVAIAAYIFYTFISTFQVNILIASILTIILTGLYGYIINKVIYLPLQRKNISNVVLLIISIAILIFFQNVLQLIFGSNLKAIDNITFNQTLTFNGVFITPVQIIIILVSIILMVLLYLLMYKTKLGRNMRAIADNKELASISGINYERISNASMIIGSSIAGIAGILIALEQIITPDMGTQIMIKGFTGAIIGNITFVPGAILGSYLLGFIENISLWFLPAAYKDAIAFSFLIIFLLFKPSGLFGIKKGVNK